MKYFIDIPGEKDIELLKKSYITMLEAKKSYYDWEQDVIEWIDRLSNEEAKEICEKIKLYVDISLESNEVRSPVNEVVIGFFMTLLSAMTTIVINMLFQLMGQMELPLEKMSRVMGEMYGIVLSCIDPITRCFMVVMIIWILFTYAINRWTRRTRVISKSFYQELLIKLQRKK